MYKSEKRQVLEFIKSRFPEEVKGIELEAWALTGWKMKAETAGRRARELAKEGYLERMGLRFVIYKYKPPQERPQMSEQERLIWATR